LFNVRSLKRNQYLKISSDVIDVFYFADESVY